MPIFHKNRQNLQTAKNDKSQQILQDKTTENHSIFCQNIENAVEPKTKKSAFFATKKSTPINKKHPQKNLTSTQAQTPQAPRKKFLKIFAAASLALITCATTLLATAPFGTGAASAAANTNLSNTTQTTSPLGLDPENDPVVYTTSSGLEIKYANALSNTNLVGFTYITMGTYTDSTTNTSYPVNWVILAYHESLSCLVGSNGTIMPIAEDYLINTTLDSSPAGRSIVAENYDISESAQVETKLPMDSVLVVSECVLFNSQVYTDRRTAYYPGSLLQQAMNGLFNNGLYFSNEQKNLIVPQEIEIAPTITMEEPQTFFALGAKGENYSIQTYLTSDALRSAYMISGGTAVAAYWLRSPGISWNYYQYRVSYYGTIDDYPIDHSMGVRPACVIQLV